MRFYYGEMVFDVPESVYYPREDSLLLAKAIENLDLHDKTAFEIGCGCGFLSILMAKTGANVTAVDINPVAVEITKKNAKANKVTLEARKSDLFLDIEGKFELIIFNPPYLPTEEGEDDKTYAGGTSGRETIERFIADVKKHLVPNGAVLIVISSLTGEAETIKLFSNQKLAAKVMAREKVPWEELIVIEAQN